MASGGQSTTDRRRLAGPSSASPIPHEHTKRRWTQARDENRPDDQARPLYVKTGLISQANGSCYIETGDTKLVCAIYGPKPLPRSTPTTSTSLSVAVKFAPFAIPHTRLTPGQSCESPSLSQALERALTPALKPDPEGTRSVVEVYVTVLEWDSPSPIKGNGGLVGLGTAVTACSIAMASAGIHMFGLVIGVGAALLFSSLGTRILVDPTFEEVLDEPVSETDWRVNETGWGVSGYVMLSIIPAMGTVTGFNVQSVRGFDGSGDVATAADKLKEMAGMVHGVAVRALETS